MPSHGWLEEVIEVVNHSWFTPVLAGDPGGRSIPRIRTDRFGALAVGLEQEGLASGRGSTLAGASVTVGACEPAAATSWWSRGTVRTPGAEHR